MTLSDFPLWKCSRHSGVLYFLFTFLVISCKCLFHGADRKLEIASGLRVEWRDSCGTVFQVPRMFNFFIRKGTISNCKIGTICSGSTTFLWHLPELATTAFQGEKNVPNFSVSSCFGDLCGLHFFLFFVRAVPSIFPSSLIWESRHRPRFPN